MWLVERGGRGLSQIPLDPIVRDTLVRWYTGHGNRRDEEASVVLVEQARIGNKWLACDCLGAAVKPPLMTPAYLSEAEKFYLRRLTGRGRPAHKLDCPFFHEQATPSRPAPNDPSRPVEKPEGYFSVLKRAPVHLARQPEDNPGGRERQPSLPRLARLLWRLLDLSGRNCASASSDEGRSISSEFAAIQRAAKHVEVAPGISLARVLWTHGTAFQSRRLYAGLRALAPKWPSDHAPQAFLLLFAHDVEGRTLHPAGSEPINIATRIQRPSVYGTPVGGPYLVLVVVGQLPQVRGYAPLRAYAQPVYSGQRFVPVDFDFERLVLRDILKLQHRLDASGVEAIVTKPLFDIQTPAGNCRPDFILETVSRTTGETSIAIVEAMGFDTDAYHDAKEITHPRMEHLAPVVEITAVQLRDGLLEGRLIEHIVSP